MSLISFPSNGFVEQALNKGLIHLPVNERVRFHGQLLRGAPAFLAAIHAFSQSQVDRVPWYEDAYRPSLSTLDLFSDSILLQSFLPNQSRYVALWIERAQFEERGEPVDGAAQVYVPWDIRSQALPLYQPIHFSFDSSPRLVQGGSPFLEERPITPEWTAHFQLLQSAIAQPTVTLHIAPVDLINLIRKLEQMASRRRTGKSVRFELEADGTCQVVLEPAEVVLSLPETRHTLGHREVYRLFDHQLLAVIETVLPHATSVEILLAGDRLPVTYLARMPGLSFVVCLPGWSDQAPSEAQTRFCPQSITKPELSKLRTLHAKLKTSSTLSAHELTKVLELPLADCERLALEAMKHGAAIANLGAGERPFADRPLLRFNSNFQELPGQPPLPVLDPATVKISQRTPIERLKRYRAKGESRYRIFRNWRVEGQVAGHTVEVIANLSHRTALRFGTCTCEDWKKEMLGGNSCAHIRALWTAAEPLCRNESENGSSRPRI